MCLQRGWNVVVFHYTITICCFVLKEVLGVLFGVFITNCCCVLTEVLGALLYCSSHVSVCWQRSLEHWGIVYYHTFQCADRGAGGTVLLFITTCFCVLTEVLGALCYCLLPHVSVCWQRSRKHCGIVYYHMFLCADRGAGGTVLLFITTCFCVLTEVLGALWYCLLPHVSVCWHRCWGHCGIVYYHMFLCADRDPGSIVVLFITTCFCVLTEVLGALWYCLLPHVSVCWQRCWGHCGVVYYHMFLCADKGAGNTVVLFITTCFCVLTEVLGALWYCLSPHVSVCWQRCWEHCCIVHHMFLCLYCSSHVSVCWQRCWGHYCIVHHHMFLWADRGAGSTVVLFITACFCVLTEVLGALLYSSSQVSLCWQRCLEHCSVCLSHVSVSWQRCWEHCSVCSSHVPVCWQMFWEHCSVCSSHLSECWQRCWEHCSLFSSHVSVCWQRCWEHCSVCSSSGWCRVCCATSLWNALCMSTTRTSNPMRCSSQPH